MLGLANYGSSGSEDEISDEEVEVSKPTNGINKISENIAVDLTISSKIKFPQPKQNKIELEEEDDDEFLHKKATPSIAPPKKEKVKIFIPKLSDFKEDDDEDYIKKVKMPIAKKKAGLLGMLPKPSNSFAPAPKPKAIQIPANIPRKPSTVTSSDGTEPSTSNTTTEIPKKVGFIPYKLMSHAQKTDDKKKKKEESDSDDDDPSSFFSFASNDDDLPKVNDEEVRALVEREQSRMEERKRQHEESLIEASTEDIYQPEEMQQQNETQLDEEAMRALLGGNRAKRSKIEDIQIIDLNADEVMPNRDEWIRRSLAGETGFIATGKINEKVSLKITAFPLHKSTNFFCSF